MITRGPGFLTARFWRIVAWLVPAATAILVCLPAYRGEFIWDDRGLYIVENDLLRRADGPWRFWFTTDCVDYYPLTYTALWLEWRLAGLDTRLYHAVNFVVHGVATGLLVPLLGRLRVPLPWLVALLFAVHPLQVETVAWISQQKTLLATALGFAAVLDFLGWERHGSRWACGRCLGWFGLSLAAKPVFIMLPILCAAWLFRGGRLASRQSIALVAALLMIAAVFGIVGIPFQQKGFAADVRSQDVLARLASLGWVAWFYVIKTVWFWEPCFIYPRWQIDGCSWLHWLPNLGILAMTAALFAGRVALGMRPLAAWLVYLTTMLPVLGIVDVGFWQFSYVADHYVYQSLPAILVMLIGIPLAVSRRAMSRHDVFMAGPDARRIGGVIACLLVVPMLAVSWRRAHDFRHEQTLWRDTVDKNPAAEIAWYQLAQDAARDEDYARAEACYRQALVHGPKVDRTWNELGAVLRTRGDWSAARDAYAACLRLERVRPRTRVEATLGVAAAEIQLGNARAGLEIIARDVKDALERARLSESATALIMARAAVYRLQALRALAAEAEATDCLSALEGLLDRSPQLREPIARTFDEVGDHAAAARLWREVADADSTKLPRYAVSLLKSGDSRAAVAACEAACRAMPDDPGMLLNLGRALEMAGRAAEAADAFQRAERLGHQPRR